VTARAAIREVTDGMINGAMEEIKGTNLLTAVLPQRSSAGDTPGGNAAGSQARPT
jgi:hypothetical protein